MFSITCSGASLSKNKDLYAVGDFVGHIKVFKSESPTSTHILHEGHIPDQVRYLHFHDYHNAILFIGTISGAVYVWNVLT